MSEHFKLTHRVDGDTAVIEVDGELGYDTARRLRDLFRDLLTRREIRWIALNLEQCGFFDASGLSAIIGAMKRVQTVNGRLALICTQDHVVRVFRLTGLDKRLLIADSESAALAMLRQAREDETFRHGEGTGGHA
jgi:anti-sigma B factor antagonist